MDIYTTLTSASWPSDQLGQAVEALIVAQGASRGRGGGQRRPQVPAPPLHATAILDDAAIGPWIDSVAGYHGWEAEDTHAAYAEIERLLLNIAPAILRIPQTTPPPVVHEGSQPPVYEHSTGMEPIAFLALVKANRTHLTVLQPDNKMARIPLATVRDAVAGSSAQPHMAALNRILDRSEVGDDRRTRVRQSLLNQMIGPTPITGFWRLRLSAGAPLIQQIQSLRSPWRSGLLAGITAIQLLVTVLAWWIIGRSALVGHFEVGWLWAWALLLMTTIPLQLAMNGLQSELVLTVSTLFKERLLFGALRLRPESVRTEGAGHFLGRVFSADALEQLSMAGGVVALLALIQLLIAGAVLALGAGGWGHVLLLAAWTFVMLALGWRVYRHERRIHKTHRSLTNDLVEQMVGHQTRLVQEAQDRWHDAEDRNVANYQQQLAASDRATSRFKALIPRGWMVVGMVWFFVVLLAGEHSVGRIAVSLGGVLFARQAFSSIVLGTQSIIGALLSWADVKPLFDAARLQESGSTLSGHSSLTGQTASGAKQPVLTLRNVGFRYPSRDRAVLDKCSLKIHPGQKLLLQGPSGGGKSTLVNLMTGLEKADHGTLLVHGTDHKTMSEESWRQRIIAVPQFHQNHVLTGSLAFNLLMGKAWPAASAELKRAGSVCRALGLGDLLDRMPAGLQQIVGEGGWQLSHGERSRLYIGRAILQDADLVILDESFGALDPESLAEALETVLEQVPTLMVVAHP